MSQEVDRLHQRWRKTARDAVQSSFRPVLTRGRRMESSVDMQQLPHRDPVELSTTDGDRYAMMDYSTFDGDDILGA